MHTMCVRTCVRGKGFRARSVIYNKNEYCGSVSPFGAPLQNRWPSRQHARERTSIATIGLGQKTHKKLKTYSHEKTLGLKDKNITIRIHLTDVEIA